MLKHDKCQPFEDEIARLKEENKILMQELEIAKIVLWEAGLIGAAEDVGIVLEEYKKN
jgi:hypothetical protein